MEWLLWLDLETTGLNPDNCKILQIACILTNMSLDTEHVFGEINLNCDTEILEKMDEWCIKTHTSSGLIEKVKQSIFNIEDSEKSIFIWLDKHVSTKDTIYLAGNSVHFDKMFINKYMPMLTKRLSYRILDVSGISLLCKNINKDIYLSKPKKNLNHTALSDIIESLDEMRYYKKNFLKTELAIHKYS